MSTIGNATRRITLSMIVLLLALAVAVPQNAISAAAAVANDDFNRCSLDTSVWTFENPGNFPSTAIVGRYQGDSALRLTVPAGEQATFSNRNTQAPRILQSVTDDDITIEVKFNSALGRPNSGAWKIQGLLFRDTTLGESNSRWLRFDLDSNASTINYYVGYIDEDENLTDISGPNVIGGSDTSLNAAPLYLRVRYVKSTNTWSVGYRLGNSGSIPYRATFTESQISGLDSDFVVSQVGIFAGATGTNPPGTTALVDYIKNVADTGFTDDANTLTVNTAGTGSGTVNWPDGAQCTGNRVTLTATAASGSRFTSWTGTLTGTSPTLQVNMTQPHTLTATFTSGAPVDLPFDFFVPYIRK